MSVILTAYKGERLLYNVMLGLKEFASKVVKIHCRHPHRKECYLKWFFREVLVVHFVKTA